MAKINSVGSDTNHQSPTGTTGSFPRMYSTGQIKCSPRAMESRCFFIIWPSERFQRWMVLFDLLLFQFISSQFLSIGSWMSELVAFQFIWSVAQFLLWISMDDGTFSYVLSSFGFNVETDVGINGCFAPFWLLGTHYLNLAAWFE